MNRVFKLLTILTILAITNISFAYNRVVLSPGYFPDPTIGRPVSSADIYVGIVDLDPEVVANQKQMSVQQEDGTIVAVSQPISTSAGGVPQYSGSPVTILVEGNYSLKVLDSAGSQVYYVPKLPYATPLATYKLSDYQDLADAAATLNALDVDLSLYIDEDSTMDENVSFDEEVLISPTSGNVITLGAYDLTVNKRDDIAPFQWVDESSSGNLIFGEDASAGVRPEWWGIDGTADEVQINQSQDSIAVAYGYTILLPKTYTIADEILVQNWCGLVGSGKKTIILGDLTSKSLIRAQTQSNFQHLFIRDLQVDNTDRTNASSIGIDLKGVGNSTVTDVLIKRVELGLNLEYSTMGYYNKIVNPVIETIDTGILVEQANSANIHAPRITQCQDGIKINQASNVNIFGGSIEDFSEDSNGGAAITLGDGANAATGCNIYGTRMETSNVTTGKVGVKIQATSGSNNLFGHYFSISGGSGNLNYDDNSTNITNNFYGDDAYYSPGQTAAGSFGFDEDAALDGTDITSQAGAITTVSGSIRYRVKGAVCFFSLRVVVTTKGTASGYMQVALPVPRTDALSNTSLFQAGEFTATGLIGIGRLDNGTANLNIWRLDPDDGNNLTGYATPFTADGEIWECSGSYEIKPT